MAVYVAALLIDFKVEHTSVGQMSLSKYVHKRISFLLEGHTCRSTYLWQL